LSHIRYLFICSEAGPGELRYAADALRQSPRKLYTYDDEYKYLLDSLLCHNLFAELKTHLIRSGAMLCMPV